MALERDVPYINTCKTIWRHMEIRLKVENPNHPYLVDVGTCNIHAMHNAFVKDWPHTVWSRNSWP